MRFSKTSWCFFSPHLKYYEQVKLNRFHQGSGRLFQKILEATTSISNVSPPKCWLWFRIAIQTLETRI